MKKYILTAIIAMFPLFILHSLAQAPDIQWQKALGGTSMDQASSLDLTTDGGYIIAGTSGSNDGDVTNDHGGGDHWLVKLTGAGDLDWQKALGGSGNEHAYSIQQTADAGYIIAGLSNSDDGDVTGNHGIEDFWVVKLTSTGGIDWQRSLGGTGADVAYSIDQTADGGYIVAGSTSSNNGDVTGYHGLYDYWVVKLTDTGAMEWQKTLGGTGHDVASSFQQTVDGGYIVAGHSQSNNGDVTGNHGSNDFWVVKLTSMGALDWQRSLGGSALELASSIQQTTDSGFIVAGYSNSTDGDVTGNHGSNDLWVVKLTNMGDLDWQRSLGGTGSDTGSSIKQTGDGGYSVAGSSYSSDGDVTGGHGEADYWIVRLTNTGMIEWQKALGGTGYDLAALIELTDEAGYIVVGNADSIDGDVTGNHGYEDYWVVKLSSPVGVDDYSRSINYSIYPNPTDGYMWIEITTSLSGAPFSLLDITGRTALSGKLSQNSDLVDVSHLVPGVYFIQINDLMPQKLVRH